MGVSLLPIASTLSLVLLLSMTYTIRGVESKEIAKRNAMEKDQHEFHEIGKCDRKFFKKFSKVMMSSNCMPRPVIVDLISSSPGILLVPSKVEVNRCAGECHAKLSCMPTNKTTIPVEVEQLHVLDELSGVKCGIINVEVHSRCRCECTVMEHHCNPKQLYIPRKCMCLCMNDEERKLCYSKGSGRFWNSSTCRCECLAERECTTGLVWVPERCSCAKLMADDMNSIEDD
ncbi:uncharacterized protein [Hetaerina americana]|uniref:uncharacterized protein n=1 Tax=Hetaerina americana TaxID=62018 RepID=UPI003A7F315C